MTDISNKLQPDFRTQAQTRWQQISEQIKRDKEEQTRKRKEGRPQGELTASLIDKLHNCNPQQLHNAIARCHKFLKLHRTAPSEYDCHRPFLCTVLVSAPVGNKRYQLERQSCGKNCTKCPNHGPYLYVYRRDGAFFPWKSLGKYPFKTRIPRKVSTAIRDFRKQEGSRAEH